MGNFLDLFYCKYVWFAKKTYCRKKGAIFHTMCHQIDLFLFIFLMQVFFVVETCLNTKVSLTAFAIFAVIISVGYWLYLKKALKKRHIVYNQEYMKNKWFLPIFICICIFTCGGGMALAAFLSTP